LTPPLLLAKGLFEGALGNTERESGDADPTGIERLHEVDESHSLFAEPIFFGDFDVFEDELSPCRMRANRACSPSSRRGIRALPEATARGRCRFPARAATGRLPL
jgi:hypothetical protein